MLKSQESHQHSPNILSHHNLEAAFYHSRFPSKTKMSIKIIVRNHSLEPQSFSIFNQAPSDSSLPGQLWWNTWATADQVDAQTGETTFGITETYYAICGAAPKALAKGLVISTTNSEVASLGTTSTKGSNWLINIPPGQTGLEFITNSKDSDILGGFTINTVGDTFAGPTYRRLLPFPRLLK